MRVIRRLLIFALLLVGVFWLDQRSAGGDVPVWLDIIEHAIRALAALAFAMLLDALLQLLFWNGYLRRVLGAKIPRLLPLSVSVIIYVSIAFNLLKHDYGVSIGGAIAASGVVAVILGFALRSVILDLFTGLAVSIDRSYTVGDWITVSSRDLAEPVLGKVEDIDWRVTKMRCEDGTLFVMPNSLGGIFSIINHSQPREVKRLSVTILLPHETPNARVEPLVTGAVLRALESDGFSATPVPVVLMKDITRDGIEYEVRFWSDIHKVRPTTATSHIRKAIYAAISQNGLVIPARKHDLRAEYGEGAGLERDVARAVTALMNVPLFQDTLTPEEIEQLAAKGVRRHFAATQRMIAQGQEGSPLFVLLSGAAEGLCRASPLSRQSLRY